MPVVRFDIKFTEEERALLRSRAKKENLTEADYLRVCMLTESFFSGDLQAIRMMRGRLGLVVRDKLNSWIGGGAVARSA